MKARFPCHAVIAFLAFVLFLPGAEQAYAEPAATAALSPPSNPLGERVITNNNLVPRVVLYEETPSDPQGRRAVGSVVWSTETKSSDAANTPELVLRAAIDIPDRKMGVTLMLRRVATLSSTSHTIEVQFKLPPDFYGGGIFNVPGFWMKPSAQWQGAALAGLVVKVKPGYFLIGLSNAPANRERNIQLLKDRPWIDIPIVYTNNRRAILALEKGATGEQAFQQAFAAWKE
jgi:hypothetical protein